MTRTLAVQGESGLTPDPDLHKNADFARKATISAFGWRHARALDQGDFVDRPPGQFPAPVRWRSAIWLPGGGDST